MNELEIDKTLHTSEEKDDIQRARDKFRMFDNKEQERVKLVTSDEFVTATGFLSEDKVWCELSTTLRCSGEEALSFLLDVTSRSLSSERDVVDDDDGNNKEIVKEEGHSRTVKIVEEVTGAGVRFNNEIARKLVWKMRRENLASSTRRTTRDSSEAEVVIFGSPTTEDIENAGVKRGVSKLRSIVSSLSFSQRRRSSAKILETKTDNSIVALKIIQVSEEESTMEVLVDTPKKYKMRKKKI